MHDRPSYTHRVLGKLDIAPFQPKQLALAQTCRRREEHQCTLAQVQAIKQRSDFSRCQQGRRVSTLRTLANQLDRVAVKKLVPASMIENDGK
jgi:hypothetical protein